MQNNRYRVSAEELEIAKHTDLPALLESLGYHVTKKGRYHSTTEMDSLRIKNRRTWFRYSEQVGGDAIAFLQHFHGMEFVDAVQHLLAFNGYSRDAPVLNARPTPPALSEETGAVEFALPERNAEHRHVYAYDTSRFKGIFVALNTPYDKHGNVNPDAIKKIARAYKKVGVTGMYVCGSTGEGVLLDVAERKLVTETLINEVGDCMTIIAHVGAPSTRHSAELAEHAWKCGAHAVSAVPCIYYRPSEDSIEQHWKGIMDAADIPFVIYNIPQLTGYDLSPRLFKKMLTYERVSGIKNTSMNAYQTEQLKTIGGKDFIVFNGPDEQYLAGRIMGADAGIGGTYGTMPEIFLKLEDCISKKQFDQAQIWQVRANELITELLSYPSLYGACKTIIRERFTDIGEPRRPFLPVPLEYPGLKDTMAKMERYIAMID